MAISRDTIRGFFRDNVARDVDLARPMLWGFFFTDRSKGRLKKIAPKIKQLELRIVDVFPANGIERLYFLHAEHIATYTADRLFAFCMTLRAFAEKHSCTFDGFDVGNVDDSPLGSA